MALHAHHSSQNFDVWTISAATLPIGQMSEEAQESFNKYNKKFGQDYARKCGRKENMEDLLSRLLIDSDPYILNIKKHKTKNLRHLSPEAADLLIEPRIDAESSDDEQYPDFVNVMGESDDEGKL